MAKVIQYEKDESVNSVVAGDYDLPIYIPGYATFGPANTPTLCQSVEEFERKFGRAPYQFKGVQLGYNGEVLQAKNTYEKGYIYAHEIVSKDMPIVFERICDASLPTASRAWNVIETIYNATYNNTENYNTVGFTATRNDIGTSLEYTTGGLDFSKLQDPIFGALPEHTILTLGGQTFEFDTNGDVVLSSDTNMIDGHLDISGNSCVIHTTTNLNQAASFRWETIIQISSFIFTSNAQGVRCQYVSGGTATNLPSSYQIRTTQMDINTLQFSVTLPNQVVTIQAIAQQGGVIAGQGVTFKALYPGKYGEGIRVTTSYIGTTIMLTVEYEDTKEIFYPSLNEQSEYYIANIASNIISVEVNVDQSILSAIKLQTTSNTLVFGAYPYVDEFNITNVYDKMMLKSDNSNLAQFNTYWNRFIDKDENVYGIFTSGPYPLMKIGADASAKKQLATVAEYGLGFAVIDGVDEFTVEQFKSSFTLGMVYSETNSRGERIGIYGTAFYPNKEVGTNFGNTKMPAGFSYTKAYAQSVQGNHPWEAVAGTKRGACSTISKNYLYGTDSDYLQEEVGVRVNPIQQVRGYGDCIMGNATLNNNENGLVNYSFLNVRVMTALIKRFFYKLGKKALFEANDDITFRMIKDEGEKFMNTLIDRGLRTTNNIGQSIQPYTIERIPTDKRATIKVGVRFYPIEAVEYVEEYFTLEDGFVSVGG